MVGLYESETVMLCNPLTPSVQRMAHVVTTLVTRNYLDICIKCAYESFTNIVPLHFKTAIFAFLARLTKEGPEDADSSYIITVTSDVLTIRDSRVFL